MMTFRNTRLSMSLGGLLAFALLLPLAQASVLVPGSGVPPAPLFPTGTLFVPVVTGTITTSTFSADYTQWVYSDPTNSFCSGCLDFVYQFTNHGPDVNESYSMSSFAGFKLDVGTDPFGLHDPISIDRSMVGNGPVVSFTFKPFGDEIASGETTVLLVIETNATKVKKGTVSAQDGAAGSGVAWAPTVPEPSSLALLGGGLCAVAGLARRFSFGKR